MTATGLLANPSVYAFIGGLLGPMQILVLVGLLFSTSLLFIAMSKEYSTGKSLIMSAGLYILMAGYALVLLS